MPSTSASPVAAEPPLEPDSWFCCFTRKVKEFVRFYLSAPDYGTTLVGQIIRR